MNILRHCHSLPTSVIFIEQLINRIAEKVAVTCLALKLESAPIVYYKETRLHLCERTNMVAIYVGSTIFQKRK